MKKLYRSIFVITLTLVVVFRLTTLTKLEAEETNPISSANLCVSLNYHRVRPKTLWNSFIEAITGTNELKRYTVYKDDFEKQLDILVEEGAYFATLEELEYFRKVGKFPKKCVWISFDDVDKSVYEYAYPILKERQIPFTLFVISGMVGSKNFNNLEMATWDDLRDMRDSGLASFGSHTHNMHYIEDNVASFLNKENYEEFREDLITSVEVMEKELGIKVDSVAYPFGETNDDITKIVSESGFSNAFILSPNPVTPDSSPFYIDRYLIYKDNFEELVVPWLNSK